MKLRHCIIGTAALCLALFASAAPSDPLETGFQTPPDSAKPHTWWHWLNGNVTKSGITKDLEAMKAVGLGGFQQFDAGMLAAGPVKYNSPHFHELMSFVFSEADRLGLDAGFHNASGWSSTGGPWITPENSMKTVVWSEVSVRASDTQVISLSVPKISDDLRRKNNLVTDFYRDIVALAFPTPKDTAYRIKDWQEKALLKGTRSDVFVPDLRPAPADAVIPAAKVKDLTDRMDAHGKLSWTPPDDEDWTVVRIGYTSTGVMNHPASKAGQGLEVDKLSRQATDVHWENLINKIIADAKGSSALKTILIDSYEVGMQNWTEGFNEEFKARRGYDLIPHLLCVTGRVLDNTETTERVLWDLRTTVAELMAQNYFGYFAERCHARGLKLALEPYGSGSFDAAASALLADIPMPEFWQEKSPGPLWQWTAQVIPSAAHLSGRSIVGAESYTAMKGDWKDHPYSLKKLGDWAFAKGVNRYYFHTFAQQPWNDAVKPGMTFGPYGGNFHRNNTWYPKSRAWMEYIARCQFLLQAGTFQADVLALYGDERSFNNFLGGKEALDWENPPGLIADLGGMSSLDNLSVDANGDTRVTFNGKLLDTRYELLVLKRANLMTPEHVAKLGALADKGAKIFAPKPLRSPSLQNFPAADQTLQALIKRYWDTGLIREAKDFAAAAAALKPDCEVPESILFNRHRIGADDFYFIANQKDEARDVTATFRVSGKQPELWNPLTGEITDAPNWKALADGRTEVSLNLTPVDSRFVVFRKPTTSTGKATPKTEFKDLLTLNNNWTVNFDPNWGPKEPVAFDQLTPWNENTNDAIKYFSGTATYKKSFELPKQNSRLVLDLGQVEVMARVTLNGKDLGTLWKPPFQVDVTKAAKPGANTLEVEVTDLWVNRLIGDERFPSWGAGYPDWLTAGKAPPSDAPRKTFAASKHWKKNDPLLPSGLIGPVTLRAAEIIPAK